MGAVLMIRHTVADFDAWKAGFDAHGDNRRLHNCQGHVLARDGNAITVFTLWPSRADAQAFADDPSLKEAMQNAGVVGGPEVAFLDLVEEVTY